MVTMSLDLLLTIQTSVTDQTEKTLLNHLQAFADGDIDAVMSDYTEDSVLITPDGTLKGLGEIRPLFEKFLGEILPPGSAFEMLQQIIEGEVAYIFWSAESSNYKIPLGTDTLIVRDGKIAIQTFAGQMEAKSG
jgi:ketosteroid isomerase-like protein